MGGVGLVKGDLDGMLHNDGLTLLGLGLASSLSVFSPDFFQMGFSILALVFFAGLSLPFVVGAWLDALLHYLWTAIVVETITPLRPSPPASSAECPSKPSCRITAQLLQQILL